MGQMLRIDPRDPAALPQIFAKGLRNPWRFSFDRRTGDLVIGDVGHREFGEVDFAAAPGLGQGANYGWNRFEGESVFDAATAIVGPVVEPAITQTHSAGWCSVVGGFVVRDPELPELVGRYVYSDFCRGDVRSVTLPAARDDEPTGLAVARPVSFGEDACGAVYVASLLGSVHRLSSGGAGSTGFPSPTAVQPVAPVAAAAGAAPASETPGAAPATFDRAPPVLTLVAPRRVRLSGAGRLPFAVGCDEPCTVRAGARLLDRRAGALTRTLGAGSRTSLAMRLPAAVRGALRRSLRRRAAVTLLLRVRVADAAGNARTTTRRVRVVS